MPHFLVGCKADLRHCDLDTFNAHRGQLAPKVIHMNFIFSMFIRKTLVFVEIRLFFMFNFDTESFCEYVESIEQWSVTCACTLVTCVIVKQPIETRLDKHNATRSSPCWHSASDARNSVSCY